MDIVAWKQGHSEKIDEAKVVLVFLFFSEMLDIVEYELLHLLLFFIYFVMMYFSLVFLGKGHQEVVRRRKVNELQAY